ncbi:ribonuclease P protein component [Ferroacidibacillus organovorans]|nr:ribonuclease P protein component [Ferroacidibacillus organovorans]
MMMSVLTRKTLRGHRMRSNREFRFVFTRGRSQANKYYVLYVVPKQRSEISKIGLSVSKKVGNAVIRNRVKRILREILRERISLFSEGYDVVIIARKDAAGLSFRESEVAVDILLKRLKLI